MHTRTHIIAVQTLRIYVGGDGDAAPPDAGNL